MPVYNRRTIGGVGRYGEYVLGLLGSSHTESLLVSTHPPGEILLDLSHIDLFETCNTPELAWQPLLGWIRGHRQKARIRDAR